MDLPFQVVQSKKIKNSDDNESMTKNLLQLTQKERERYRERERGVERCNDAAAAASVATSTDAESLLSTTFVAGRTSLIGKFYAHVILQ